MHSLARPCCRHAALRVLLQQTLPYSFSFDAPIRRTHTRHTTHQLKDITEEVLPFLPISSPARNKKKKSAIATGDLFVLHAETAMGPFVLATFHGDTQVRADSITSHMTITLYAIARYYWCHLPMLCLLTLTRRQTSPQAHYHLFRPHTHR